uniref:Uncharacterized protein n=1 Tax=Romanomermis culicivorax TaxID=13658 RepID=A0A915JYD4_ROMCU
MFRSCCEYCGTDPKLAVKRISDAIGAGSVNTKLISSKAYTIAENLLFVALGDPKNDPPKKVIQLETLAYRIKAEAHYHISQRGKAS